MDDQKTIDENLAMMDEAAAAARIDLEQLTASFSAEHRVGAESLVQWYQRHFMQAGHKRLGRLLKGGLPRRTIADEK